MKNDWDNYWIKSPTGSGTNKWKNKNTSLRQKRSIRLFERYVKSGMVVCDAACGSGFFGRICLSMNCKVYCIDYSEEAIELAKKTTRNKAEYIVGNLLDNNFVLNFQNYFDLLATDGLFEHFNYFEQINLLNNLKSMLKRGGLMITVVPNLLSHWQPIRRVFLEIPGVWEKPFTMKKLISLVKQSEMEIIETGGIHVMPFDRSPEILARFIGSAIYVVSKRVE
jgi:2-polyprenyl-3-methyl-5-hydroxy-6-metoxy-1,4-benzoquinol methylase